MYQNGKANLTSQISLIEFNERYKKIITDKIKLIYK